MSPIRKKFPIDFPWKEELKNNAKQSLEYPSTFMSLSFKMLSDMTNTSTVVILHPRVEVFG